MFRFHSFVSLALLNKLLVLAMMFLSATGWALPTVLNYCPSVDLVPDRNLMFQTSYYKFQFTDPASKALIKKSGSMIYSLEYGLKKAEFGVDLVAEKRFVNMDSALYAGPTAWNFKYRFLTQGTKQDSFSLIAGAFNLGAKSYNRDYYGPSPYIMAAKAFKDFRVHLGYQFNIMGYKRLDTDRRKNNDIIAGIDATVIKDKDHPVSLIVDYSGGPGKMIGVGFWHVISPKWSWGVSTYHPIKSELSVSKFQLPKQYWVAISYYLPL